MKVTRRQLREIIRESMLLEAPPGPSPQEMREVDELVALRASHLDNSNFALSNAEQELSSALGVTEQIIALPGVGDFRHHFATEHGSISVILDDDRWNTLKTSLDGLVASMVDRD